MIVTELLNRIGTSESWDGGYDFIGFRIDEDNDFQGLRIRRTPSILVETSVPIGDLTSFDIAMDEHLFTYASSFVDGKCYCTLHLHLPPHLSVGVTSSNLTLVKSNNEYTITKLTLTYNEGNV